jgi:hypothetical protein
VDGAKRCIYQPLLVSFFMSVNTNFVFDVTLLFDVPLFRSTSTRHTIHSLSIDAGTFIVHAC